MNGWQFGIDYDDTRRLQCQQLRNKLGRLIPRLEKEWESDFDRIASLKELGYNSYTFCSVFLANGYIKGWKNMGTTDVLKGDQLRDLLLEADDFQQRFFQGPLQAEGMIGVDNMFYTSHLHYMYTDGKFKVSPGNTLEDTDFHVDIWKDGLLAKFFQPVATFVPANMANDCLTGAWKKVEEADGALFRTIDGEAGLKVKSAPAKWLLVRAKIGTDTTDLSGGTKIALSAAGVTHNDVVCKPRWVNWLLPKGAGLSSLNIKSEKPVRVYAVEIYKEE